MLNLFGTKKKNGVPKMENTPPPPQKKEPKIFTASDARELMARQVSETAKDEAHEWMDSLMYFLEEQASYGVSECNVPFYELKSPASTISFISKRLAELGYIVTMPDDITNPSNSTKLIHVKW
jgi:hypothetical protein